MASSISERPAPLTEITDNDPRRHSNSSHLSLALAHSHSHSPLPDKGSNSPSPQPTLLATTTSASPRMEVDAKRQSTGAGAATAPVQTITLNLNDYASNHGTLPTGMAGSESTGKAPHPNSVPSLASPLPSSPSTKPTTSSSTLPVLPTRPDKPLSLTGRPVSGGSLEAEAGHDVEAEQNKTTVATTSTTTTAAEDGLSPLLVAHRAALRPSPLSATFSTAPSDSNDAAGSSTSYPFSKPLPSPDSTGDTPRSSLDSLSKPPTRAKPSWLKRASLAPGMRSKSRSPATSDTDLSTLPTSASLPPTLPPRHGSPGIVTSTAGGSLLDRASQQGSSMLPPELPAKPQGLLPRGMLANGQGRTGGVIAPPQHPGREGNLKGRIAAWSAPSSGSVSRSQSSNSLASQTFTPSHQRLPSSAQRVIGQASSAVSKGWAGLRSRGVGGSISNMSALGQSRSPREGGLEPSSSWSSLTRRTNDRRPAMDDLVEAEGPLFVEGVVKRKGREGHGRVFGRDLADAGRTWAVYDAAVLEEGESEYSQRRKQSLPAIVVRCVDYLEEWGPKEEGIFRISGRSSHVARLRREFDSGADLDISLCDPGDLDPHAVAGVFKSYLRELPSSLLTVSLEPQFEKFARLRGSSGAGPAPQQLADLVQRLPSAHWFLLADIVKLIDLIPRYVEVNRMSHNALMLSLGPTLRLSGDLLDLFLRHRDSMFSTPPPPSLLESTTDLIDFGDVDIAPPSMPTPEPDSGEAFASDSASISSKATSGIKRTPPKVPKKPSLSRLLSASGTFITQSRSTTNLSNKASTDTLGSIVDPHPPRVDLPSPVKTEMGLFGLGQTEQLTSTTPPSSAPPVPAKFSDKMDESHYPTGTVEERARAFSSPTPTPIADKFRGTSSSSVPLRAPKSSTGSTLSTSSSLSGAALTVPVGFGLERPSSANSAVTAPSTPSAPSIPIGLIRSGPPIFFQSAVATDRHNRSLSSGAVLGTSSPVLFPTANGGVGATSMAVTSSTQGTKRKDDNADVNDSDDDPSLSGTPAKRLSAGPGLATKMAEEAEAAIQAAGERVAVREGVKSPEVETVAVGVGAVAVGTNDDAMDMA